MAAIEFTCEHCKQNLEATDDMAGQEVECPNCGNIIAVPGKNVPPQKICPECKNVMPPDAVLCVNCGYHLKLGKKIQTEFT